MKLTGLLKTKVDEASTNEEKKNIISAAGMELTDEELINVAGGVNTKTTASKATLLCPTCNKQMPYRIASGGRCYCEECNTQIFS